MGVTSRRKTVVTYSVDVDGETELDAAVNTSSPGQIQIVELTAGIARELDKPVGATCMTIQKPSDNVGAITFWMNDPAPVAGKCILHATDPDSISLGTGVSQVYLSCTTNVTLRIFWT